MTWAVLERKNPDPPASTSRLDMSYEATMGRKLGFTDGSKVPATERDPLHYGPYDDRSFWEEVLDTYLFWPWTKWGLILFGIYCVVRIIF